MAKRKTPIETRPPVTDQTPYTANGIDPIPAPTPPPKTDRIVNKVIIVALILIALTIGLFLRWSFESENVLDIKNSPFPAKQSQNPIVPGGVVILDADYCKNKNIEGTIRVSFLGQREVFLPEAKESGPVQCARLDFPVLIPKDLPADTYKVKFRVRYDINPLKKGVVQDFESQPIVVNAP